MPDITEKFTSHLKNVLTRALVATTEEGGSEVLVRHFLWAITTQKGCLAAEILRKSNIDAQKIDNLVPAGNTPPEQTHATPVLSDSAKRCVEKAVYIAHTFQHRYVGTEHLLAGMIEIADTQFERIAKECNLDTELVGTNLQHVLKSTSRFPEIEQILQNDTQIPTAAPISPTTAKPMAVPAQDETKSTTPALDFFTRDLTHPLNAAQIDPVIGRANEIHRVMEILCRRTKNNPILLGEPGVGKTAVVEGLAKQITAGNAPGVLAEKRILALDLAAVVAGTMYRGEFEGRMKQIIDEARANPDVILFIDEVHTIAGAGASTGSMDAANMLKPALARGEIRCIGATTPSEYKKNIENDTALERRFQSVRVEEPTQAEAIQILEGLRGRYESYHGVRITPEAIEAAVRMSARYVNDRFLPDKAIDLIDEAAASLRVISADRIDLHELQRLKHSLTEVRAKKHEAIKAESFERASALKSKEEELQVQIDALREELNREQDHGMVGLSQIAAVVSRATRIPANELANEERDRLKNLDLELKEEIIGQDSAVDRVAETILRAKTGITSPERPLASFMFVGPSGVGKTELARAVARRVFQDENALIRLDMSEYSEGYTISKLIGSPAGYVGYRDTTQLTDRVKERPYSVVLFDELEKAHRDAQNLLLQILENGTLKDSTGREVSFRHTVIIMTSNVGLERYFGASLGFGEEAQSTRKLEDVKNELEQVFRPEMLNRIDHILPFSILDLTSLETIAQQEINRVLARITGVRVKAHASAVKWIAKEAHGSKVGARAIRRLVGEHIQTPLAKKLLLKQKPKDLLIKMVGKSIRVTKPKKTT